MCKYWVLMLAAFFLTFNLEAQTHPQIVDVVYLKSGGSYTGEIVSYEQGVKVVLRQLDGKEITIEDADIKKILQGVSFDENDSKNARQEKKPVVAKTKGLYNATMLGFAMGSSNQNGLALGAGFSNVTGYQFRAIGLGIGIGVDSYARRGETIYPVFAELRGFIPSKKKQGNIYVSASGGYGFAFKKENVNITEAEGGYMAYPAAGYRVATSEGLDVNVDFGVKFQKAKFTRSLFNGDIEIRDILYRRLVVRVGLTLWK
jgi:hypothetical protein